MIPRLGKDTNRNWTQLNDWNPNVEQIADQCFIGPQGEIMQATQNWNTTYGRGSILEPIGVTKRFYWKRGTYNNVKEIYTNRINRFGEKPRGMGNMRDRINTESWQSRNFWTSLIDIEDKLYRIRTRGYNWLDNTDTVETYVEWLKNSINEGLERNQVNFPNIDVEIYIDDADGALNSKFILLIRIKNIEINVKHGGQIIGKVPTNNILLCESVKLWPHINSHCDREDPFAVTMSNNQGYSQRDGYFFDELHRWHPFVSRHSRRYDGSSRPNWTNICQGDHSGSWNTALWNLNLDVLLHYINIWANNYDIPTTNPLNRINKCFYGLPKGLDERIITLVAGDISREDALNNQWSSCKYPDRYLNLLAPMTTSKGWVDNYNQEYILGIEDHCNKCQLQTACTHSIDLNLYPFDNKGIIMMSFGDGEGLSDIPFMRQQLLMHFTAKDVIERSNLNHILLKPGYNKFCLTEIDEELNRNDEAHTTEYNLDYWYTSAEHRDRELTTELMMESWNIISGNEMPSWIDLANEYCDLVYGAELENLSEDDRYDFNEFSDGLREHDLFQEIVHYKAMIHKPPAEGVEIMEEDLSTEDRVIRWAAQRSGAITFNQ